MMLLGHTMIGHAQWPSDMLTYLPHKAVADVSNHNEPIGRKCGIQLVRKSVRFRFNCFQLQVI